MNTSQQVIKLNIEESISNFGHNNLVYSNDLSVGDIKINSTPLPEENIPEDEEKYYYRDKILSSIPLTSKESIVKLSNQPLIERPDMFKLYKYSIGKLKPPNITTGPTLVSSLFMPNDKLPDTIDISIWTKKYLANQLKLCFVFNYFYPDGNHRIYFDYYMLEKFRKINNVSTFLKFKDIIGDKSVFTYSNDFCKDASLINELLGKFYDTMVSLDDNILFENAAAAFIYYFTIASSCTYDSTIPTLMINPNNKCIDMFVYKLSGPFIENLGLPNEGHITNGFIGQHMRFIALRQKTYKYKHKDIDIDILAPKHLVWRDAHANLPSTLDSEWISAVNIYSQQNEMIYFLPVSKMYVPSWHGYAYSNVDRAYRKRSAVAGVIQVCNSSINDDNMLYLSTIGLPFIMCANELLIAKIRPKYGGIAQEYSYGIDEYILTEFFNSKQILANSIYFNYKLSGEYLDIMCTEETGPQFIAVFFILELLIKKIN